jgi:hypothetical protein
MTGKLLNGVGGWLAGTVLLVVALVIALPASASPTAGCTVNATLDIAPGVTRTPTQQVGTGSGTVTCEGLVRGRSLDGSAPITLNAVSQESCEGGSGTGTFTAGPLGEKGVTVIGDFQFTRTDFNNVTLDGTASIQGQGVDKTFVISGSFHYAFLEGNCVFSPITRVAIQDSPFTVTYR